LKSTASSTASSTAIRQIILIRHGQYFSEYKADELRALTELGRQQAISTGERLRELQDSGLIYPVKEIYYSTMKRATETHDIIQEHLSEISANYIKPCSMIQEGAVYPLIPLIDKSWTPSEESFFRNGIRVGT